MTSLAKITSGVTANSTSASSVSVSQLKIPRMITETALSWALLRVKGMRFTSPSVASTREKRIAQR